MHYHCIHGAWHGAWVWDPLVDRLCDADHTVTTPELPGLGAKKFLPNQTIDLESHITISIPASSCWLVAHSYAGMITKALTDRYPDKVQGVILIEALWPTTSGQSVMDLVPDIAAEEFRRRAKESANGEKIPPPPVSQFAISDVELEAYVANKLVDHPLATFEQSLNWTNETTPKAYLIASDRDPQPYEATAIQLQSKGCAISRITGGHNLMLTNPDQVFDTIVEVSEL